MCFGLAPSSPSTSCHYPLRSRSLTWLKQLYQRNDLKDDLCASGDPNEDPERGLIVVPSPGVTFPTNADCLTVRDELLYTPLPPPSPCTRGVVVFKLAQYAQIYIDGSA